MARYILRRLLWGVVLLFVVSLVVFVLFYIFPSADPAELRAGRQASPEEIEALREAYGLDEGLYVQFLRYMEQRVVHGNFALS